MAKGYRSGEAGAARYVLVCTQCGRVWWDTDNDATLCPICPHNQRLRTVAGLIALAFGCEDEDEDDATNAEGEMDLEFEGCWAAGSIC